MWATAPPSKKYSFQARMHRGLLGLYSGKNAKKCVNCKFLVYLYFVCDVQVLLVAGLE